jgi:carbon monoxide dehydrogenase subunit G
MVRIDKQVVVDGRPPEIWEILWDVERIAHCIRGVSDVSVVEPERRYSARITQRVGPFQVSFTLAIDVLEVQPVSSIKVMASGRDAKLASRMKATMLLNLGALEESRTSLDIHTDVKLQGRLATLGQGIIARKADEELAHFSAALERELGRRDTVTDDE